MSLWKSLINAGAPDGNPAISAEKVRVQNTFALASIVLATPLIFIFYFLDVWEVSFVFFGTTLVLWSSIFLNKIGRPLASKFVIIGIYSAILPVYSFLIGFHSGFYLYYAIAPSLMLSIFDIQFKSKMFAGLAVASVSLAITLTIGYINQEPYTGIEPFWVTLIFWMNFTFNILIILVLTLQLVLYHFNAVIHARHINYELIENQEIIKRSLKEKEVLLAEIHHRVKNNLAVMSSLLRLQSEKSTSEDAKDILLKNADRIHSMALIHNSFYTKDNLSSIDFCQFISDLVDEMKKSYLRKDEISFAMNLEPITLPVNKAIPGGLIVNEILINAIKHAFKEKRNGDVNIKLTNDQKSVNLTISDNGIGFDPLQKEETLGLTLIHSLTEQLDGEIDVKSKEGYGTVWSLSFSLS